MAWRSEGGGLIPARRKPRESGSRGRPGGSREWIGGRLLSPFFIEDRDEPYRADIALWLEEPSGLVVGHDMIAPGEVEGAVVRLLCAVLKRPLVGPPRSPGTIRVADFALAAEVRAAVGDEIPVVVAPTPELDAILAAMLESIPLKGQPESYLGGGRLPPSVVGELFTGAWILHQIAPWKVATAERVVRMDIPSLGVEGACVSVIGKLGQSRGVLIFPSLAGYQAFRRAAGEPIPPKGGLDLGTGWLALSFERGADLPASMRREVKDHAWPVAAADAYPRVERHDPDGASRPIVERDLKIAAACATSFATFFTKHRSLFEAGDFEPVCESYFDKNDLEVRLTMPFEAFSLFDIDVAAGPARWSVPSTRPEPARAGRNDPCPCGSGRKYKRCHLVLDQRKRSAHRDRDAFHDIDTFLVGELTDFAGVRFDSKWRRFTRDFTDAAQVLQLSAPWSVYHFRVEGATVLDWFLEERGRKLSAAERACLVAQRAAWLSVWEVRRVEPGASVTLCDLLSGETRCVREVSASQTLVVRDALLGRVVDHDGASFLCGVYPRPLPPFEAAEVVRRARGRLRRQRTIPVERLRDEAFGRYLIRRWEEAVAELDARPARPTELRNTDDDPLLLTTDHFEIAPGARTAVGSQIAALEGVEHPEAGEDPSVYTFLRPGNPKHPSWDNTVIGHARLSNASLRLETNSRVRADALRERVEAVCGGQIRHRAREHADPLSRKAPRAGREPAPEAPPPEAQQILLEFKQRHYADWPDRSIPALGGKSPREAIRTRQGRAAVDVLLKDMENLEQRSAEGHPFDFSRIRRDLRLE